MKSEFARFAKDKNLKWNNIGIWVISFFFNFCLKTSCMDVLILKESIFNRHTIGNSFTLTVFAFWENKNRKKENSIDTLPTWEEAKKFLEETLDEANISKAKRIVLQSKIFSSLIKIDEGRFPREQHGENDLFKLFGIFQETSFFHALFPKQKKLPNVKLRLRWAPEGITEESEMQEWLLNRTKNWGITPNEIEVQCYEDTIDGTRQRCNFYSFFLRILCT